MKRAIFIFLILFIARGFTLCVNHCFAAEKYSFENVSAWFVYWNLDDGMESLANNPDIFDQINPFYYALSRGGRIIENLPSFRENARFASIIKKGGMKILPAIVNDIISADGKAKRLKDADIIHNILITGAKRKKHIKNILGLIKRYGYDGVDIDYENLYFKDRGLFTDFIKELSAALHLKGKALTVTVQQKTEESAKDGPSAIDWAGIAQFADSIKIMCYNFSSPLSGPGPLAPPAWVEDIVVFSKKHIPLQKITIAITLGGFDWSEQKSRSISFDSAQETALLYKSAIKWDEVSSTPHFAYFQDGKRHEVWFEDKRSVSEKLSILKKHGIKNLALWRLGGEDKDIYEFLSR